MSELTSVELRPTGGRRTFRWWGPAAVAAVAALGGLWVVVAGAPLVLVNVALVPFAFSTVLALQSLSTERSVLRASGDGRVVYSGLWRPHVLSTREAPATLVKVTLTGTGTRQSRGLLWVGGPQNFMLMVEAWDATALLAVGERNGLDLEREPEPLRLPVLAKRYPGVVPWYGAHPNITGTVVALGAITVLTVLSYVV